MELKQAEQMATSLMRHHGVFDYSFSYMKRRQRFDRAGQCNWRKKTLQLAPTFVELNLPVLVKQVILHEIAHALRPRHHHNKFWKLTATELGCLSTDKKRDNTKIRCYGDMVKNSPRPKDLEAVRAWETHKAKATPQEVA